MSEGRWLVPLPAGAEGPFRVWVNGVEQTEGRDFVLDGRALAFSRPLTKEGRLGFWRWFLMFMSIAGTYRKNDSVDVQYRSGGAERLATALDIVSPSIPSHDADRPDTR